VKKGSTMHVKPMIQAFLAVLKTMEVSIFTAIRKIEYIAPTMAIVFNTAIYLGRNNLSLIAWLYDRTEGPKIMPPI
jgi:hypothetical protein